MAVGDAFGIRAWPLGLTDRHPNARFIVSGSAGAALKPKSQESGAGRFTDFFLPPLAVAESLAFRNLEDASIEAARRAPAARRDARDIQHLNEEFINCLNQGKCPGAVLKEGAQTDVQRFLGRDMVDKVLLRDLPGLGGIRDIQGLNRLFAGIACHSGQEISLDGLARRSGAARATINRHLDCLEAAFMIVRAIRVDDTGNSFQRMRNFKVYLTNPSMRSALFVPVHDGDEPMRVMAETAIFNQWLRSDLMRDIRYARWRQGRADLAMQSVRIDAARHKPLRACEIKRPIASREPGPRNSGAWLYSQESTPTSRCPLNRQRRP